MEIYLDSTDSKRIDLCMDYRVSSGEIKDRRFIVKWGNSQRSFEDFAAAVDFYLNLEKYVNLVGPLPIELQRI